jgi:tetratricopeptide (TPR) repeat protein
MAQAQFAGHVGADARAPEAELVVDVEQGADIELVTDGLDQHRLLIEQALARNRGRARALDQGAAPVGQCLLQDLGDYEGAKGLLEKALASAEQNFGAAHPTTAGRYSNLATVLQALGDYEGALALAAKALAIFQNKLPAGHPYISIDFIFYPPIHAKLLAAGCRE